MSKKKLCMPILVFLIGSVVLVGTIYHIQQNKQQQRRESARLNAMTYGERMVTELGEGIQVTETLKQIVISENGTCNKFETVAENIMTDYIQSIQLAPGGTVTDIYPAKGNEAGKIDLIHDKDRGSYSCYARDHDMTVMQGPFTLKQGGKGIAVRNPVYIEKNGKKEFWGFTIVIIRVPEIYSHSLQALKSFGYQFRLLKTVAPWDDTYKEVCSSGNRLEGAVSYTFQVGADKWKLQVMPDKGWKKTKLVTVTVFGGVVIVLLLTGLTLALLVLEERRKNLKILAVTDKMTKIYNRSGFDEAVMKYLRKYPRESCVMAELDVDNFKFINDMYGHASGDQALENLAAGMKSYFGEKAILGRNGGDEFNIFLPDTTCELARKKLEEFTHMERTFSYKGEKQSFLISLGYAEYPKHAKNIEELSGYADAALYEVKRRSKNGCMAYREGFRVVRTQLGFALKDVSEHLPGAFLIYKADIADDKLLFANHEMLRLAGCRDLDEFFAYTGQSFRNLIAKEEQERVEKDIWSQIHAGKGHSNDYVSFSMVKKDGSQLYVLDHGRIVENAYYGKVFYVLIMDCNFMKKHYE